MHRAPPIFINLAHTYDHLFMLLFPMAAVALEGAWGLTYDELLALSFGGFIAFGAGTLPAGWLGDRWSRSGMLTLFFFGIGAASIGTGLAQSPLGVALGLTCIGLFASIYHPVGIAMVVDNATHVGRALGVNGVYGNMGVALAAIVAGGLSDLLGWRAAFLVPGGVALATGALYMACLHNDRPSTESPVTPHDAPGEDRQTRVRVFSVLILAALLGGVTYTAMTVAMPKMFDIRVARLAGSGLGIGGVLAVLYGAAAFAQIIVGRLIDRLPIRGIYICMLLGQAPVLLIASRLDGPWFVAACFVVMALVFGAIPIHDALVARHTPAAWRSRAYALMYLVGLGVGALGAPLAALIYRLTGGFTWLFLVDAAAATVIAGAAALLPTEFHRKIRI